MEKDLTMHLCRDSQVFSNYITNVQNTQLLKDFKIFLKKLKNYRKI